MSNRWLTLGSILVFIAACCLRAGTDSSGPELRAFEAVEPHMGTLFRIKLYAGSEAQAQSIFRAAFDRVSRLDETLSDYKPDSELRSITRTSISRPMPVSDDLFRVSNAAQ